MSTGLLLIYLLCVNLVGLYLMYKDKKSARRKRGRRVRERTLLTLALVGGGPAVWSGMHLFRHKTQHASFRIAGPTGTVLWAVLFLYLLYLGLL